MNIKYINADVKRIGLNIRTLRMERDLKQEELGKGIGTSITNISRWETGTVLPSLEMILRLVSYFKVDINIIVNQD